MTNLCDKLKSDVVQRTYLICCLSYVLPIIKNALKFLVYDLNRVHCSPLLEAIGILCPLTVKLRMT